MSKAQIKNKNTLINKIISSPSIGTVVNFMGHGISSKDKNYPCDVLIKAGQYEVNGRISNFWYWQRIQKNGNLSPKTEHGYGNFKQTEKEYKIETIITIINNLL